MTAKPPPRNSPPASELGFQQLCDERFWRELNPQLTIGETIEDEFTSPHQGPDRLRARMLRDGYFDEADPGLETIALLIGEAVKTCVSNDLPPVFVFLYDQPWACFHRLGPVIADILGPDFRLLPDFWAWHVDPKKSETGWTPHRDKNASALNPDGTPKSLTIWIPLSEANPLNSCIYILPAHLDPLYGQMDFRMPPILDARALPVKPGEWLCWNQAVLHWGSRGSEFAADARMSMALEFQRGDIAAYNSPLLAPGPYPDFPFRLRLVAKQILQYAHMYGFSDTLTALAAHILNRSP